jgi:hypothetical protein
MYRPKSIFLEISSGVVLDLVAEVLPALQESFFRPAMMMMMMMMIKYRLLLQSFSANSVLYVVLPRAYYQLVSWRRCHPPLG